MKPSVFQQAIYDFAEHGEGSAIVEAVAGAGKTTTIVEVARRIPAYQRVIFLAFNKSIAIELKERLPRHVEAATLNSLGHRAVTAAYGRGFKLDANKSRQLMRLYMPVHDQQRVGAAVKKLVSAAKAYGIAPTSFRHPRFQVGSMTSLIPDEFDTWHGLIDHFDLDLSEVDRDYVIGLVRGILASGIDDRSTIDFDDQIYLPVVLGLPVPRFDWVIVDEAQDVSPVQRALIGKALAPHGRLIAVGDPRQAIYGFRGADSRALDNIAAEFNARRFPLSISYRCPQAVVTFAQQVVSHIQASPAAPEGAVYCLPDFEAADFTPGDMVVCRTNAPLITLAYALISRRVPVVVKGRDIGAGLISLVQKLKPRGLRGEHGLVEKLDKWATDESRKALEKEDDEKAAAIADKHDTIRAFLETGEIETVPALIAAMEALFSDDTSGERVVLSSVHRAKGLEAPRVFVLDPDLMPSRYARKDWQQEQERNLMYVAYTRAKRDLIFISSKTFVSRKVEKKVA